METVTVVSDLEADLSVVTVNGSWDRNLFRATSTGLRKCFAEHPGGVIVDLSALEDDAAASAMTWVTAQRVAARMAPPVHLAMCVPPSQRLADRLQRLGARRYLPVYATVRQARVALQGRLPPTDRLELTLPAEPESPSLARDLIGNACRTWQLPALLHPARLVMSELVTNAVEHAGGALTVTVTRRGGGLHLAVADLDPRLPIMRRPRPPQPGAPLDERGRGLRTVDATAAGWGCTPTPTGKTVWATVRDTLDPDELQASFTDRP